MKATRIAIVVAVFLVVIGTITTIGGLFALGFDMAKLSNLSPITHTHVLDGEVKNITVNGVESSIKLIPTDDEKVKVISKESDKIYHIVNIEEETLSIHRIDERKWYELIGIIVDPDMELEIYLPKRDYANLYIYSTSGNVFVPDDFKFDEVDIKNVSGNIEFLSNVKDSFTASTVSGRIETANVAAKKLSLESVSGKVGATNIDSENAIEIINTSGPILLENINAKKIEVETLSGRVSLEDVVAFEEINIESLSGIIKFDKVDASSIILYSTSGNIIGNFLTEKTFDVETVSGKVTLPEIQKGNKCTIKTISGNITIGISQPEQ